MGTAVPSLKDVAKAANVSVPTASRILRREKLNQFSKETRDRVYEVADRLRWRPNMLVNGMQKGKTRTIGVMVPPYDSYWSDVLYGIHDELIVADNVPITLWVKHRAEGGDGHISDLEQIHRLIDRRVDGVILWPPVTPAYYKHIEELSARNLPVVTIDHELPERYGADSVVTDEQAGARIAAQHLIERGHKIIAHLADYGMDDFSWASQRSMYFQDELAKAGLGCVVVQNDKPSGGDDAVKKLLSLEPRPTAVFAANDRLARLLYFGCAAKGLRIPEDISIIGFADLDFSAMLTPPLTTIRQNPYETGKKAARLILDRVNEKYFGAGRVNLRVGCELVERESTKHIL
jgi:LacI family transcriptional regulator